MKAELLAFAAAALGVLAVWDAVDIVGAVAVRAASVVAPMRDDREPRAEERRRLMIVGTLAASAACWLLAGALLAFVGAVATPLAVRHGLAGQARRRRARLVEAAPAVARAIADALAGGSSIRAAVAGAYAGVSGPARRELVSVRDALELGEETVRVLERLRSTAGHHAYNAIVAAILLQREAGGDLAGLLRHLAASLEHGARAEADARAATAQARFSAGLVVSLPALAVALGEIAAPGSVAGLLATPLSTVLAGVAVALQVLGWLVIRHVSSVGS